jgi:TPM domain
MSCRKLAFGCSCAAVALLAVVRPAVAVAPVIKDDAKYFTPEAIKKANEQIREIARKHGMDLLIETFESVPADQLEKVKGMSGKEKEDFFHHWAEQRAEAEVVNGVYVLVCREPTYLYVEVTPKARAVFGKEAIAKVRSLLLRNFHEKHFDEGLEGAAKLVEETLAAK